jgi:hypothetical protein
MAWTATLSKGVSFDEGLQLAVGYNLWLNGDYRIEGANGDLVKRWATLPFLVTRPAFVGHDDPWWRAGGAYELGQRFLFELGNRPETILRQGRAMIALLGVLTGLLVFRASRRLFGARGGMISLALFVLSPAMLAFGGIVSTDMSITLTLFATTCCIWGLLHAITWPRLVISLVCTGLLVLAKPTALVIVPIAAVMLIVRFVAGGGLRVQWRDREWTMTSRRAQARVFAVMVVLHIAAGWSALWAHYGFRYVAAPLTESAGTPLRIATHAVRDEMPLVFARLLAWIERTHFLPQGFHKGIDSLLANDDAVGAYMRGEWSIGGRPSFFPYAIWVKTHPTLFLLLALGAIGWWRARSRAAFTDQSASATTTPGLYQVTPHLALIGCYLAVAMTEDLNIGHRHVLPIYPSLYVLAGAIGLLEWQRRSVAKWTVLASLAWLGAESVSVRPDYLAYFAPQAGGPENGYKHLVDSSLDWGMNLPELKQWLDEHDPGQRVPLFLAYFGTDRPKHYGIKARRLPGFFDRRQLEHYVLTPGYYAISASLFQGVHTAAFGPWNAAYEQRYRDALRNVTDYQRAATNPRQLALLRRQRPPPFWANEIDVLDNLRLARLCAWLRHQGEPPHQVGHGIFIWKLGYGDLQAALLGPAVELGDPLAALRRYRQFAAKAP